MIDPDRNDASSPEPDSRAAVEADDTRAAAEPPLANPTAPSGHALTPEEQMALYEDDLKENDWGHQPC